MSGLCRDCLYWDRSEPHNTFTSNAPDRCACALTWSHNDEPDKSDSLAFAQDWESYQAVLYTAPEFGCVQFEAKA